MTMSKDISKTYRPNSELLADIHVYLIPPELWRQNLRSATNDVIVDSVSLGFLRVSPQVQLARLREEISLQIGDEHLPKQYVFLKSVGRCLTQVKGRQEHELKAKHFMPPHAYAPEVFILDGTAELVRESPSTIYNESSGTSIDERQTRSSQYLPSENNVYKNGNSPPYSDPTSPVRRISHQAGIHPSRSLDTVSPYNVKSGYPAYNQPYSHDIAAITNAHRNYPTVAQQPNRSTHAMQDKNISVQHSSHNRSSMPSEPDSARISNQEFHSISPLPNSSERHGQETERFDNDQMKQLRKENTDFIDDQLSQRTVILRDRNGGDNENHDKESASFENPRVAVYSDESSGYGSAAKNELKSSKKLTNVGHQDTGNVGYHVGQELMSATPPLHYEHKIDKYEGQLIESKDDTTDRKLLNRNAYERKSDMVSPPIRKLDSNNGKDHAALLQTKIDLLEQLRHAKEQRKISERKREDLVRKARTMQTRTNNRRAQAREIWKKRYYDEKKKTPPLEDACLKVRGELDTLHKKYISVLEGSKIGSNDQGQKKEDYRIKAVKLEYEVDDLQRRADAAKMKLTAEMKLRNQAETELRALRAELTQKKMNITLTRNQQLAALGNSTGRTPRPDASHKSSPAPISARS